MFSRHPRSVFMLRTHFIKHFFGFPPHFLVIHTLLDHNTSYLPTPFFSDLTELPNWTKLNDNVFYIKKLGIVSVYVIAKATASSGYTTLGTLPEGYRPRWNINTCVRNTVNENYQIATTGVVSYLAPDAVSRYGTIITFVAGTFSA